MFRSLALPTDLGHALHDVLTANNRHGRSDRLVAALTELATIQRATGLPSADPACFPSGIVHTSRSIKNSYPDCSTASPIQAVRALPVGLGRIEQRTDNVDLLVHAHLRRATVLDGASPTACGVARADTLRIRRRPRTSR